MAKKPAKSARDDKGRFDGADPASAATRFGPGNKASKGHGRPPDRVKQTLHDLLDQVREAKDGKPAQSLVDLAFNTVLAAMHDRDEDGNVTPAGINAAKLVFAYRYGLPKQTHELNVSGLETLGTVRGAMAAMVAKDAKDALKEPQ